MGDGISRRRFVSLAGAAGLIVPLRVAGQDKQFTGDTFDEAHRLLMSPEEALQGRQPESDGRLHDVVIAGGGVAGLAAAYWLGDRDVLLLERESETGGVAKSESWEGLEYGLGAAYLIDPDPKSTDPFEQATFRLLNELGLREPDEDLRRDRNRRRRLSSESNHCLFSNRRVVPKGEVYTPADRGFLKHVLEHARFPKVPPTDPELVEALDTVSLEAFLRNAALQRKIYGRAMGAITPLGWEAIEYFCWGAFGTSAAETSAYHGLNFLAAETGSILVFPGGNGFVTRRMAERIRRDRPKSIRTGACAVRIERAGDREYAVTAAEGASLRRYRARAVIFAAPLFLAPKIIAGLAEEQREAIGTLSYRAYVVANFLLRRRIDEIFAHPAIRNGYELTRLHGVDLEKQDIEELAGRAVFSDVVVADFPVWRDARRSVLTVYCPYPHDNGRAGLMAAEYADLEAQVRGAVLAGFSRHGLRESDIADVRLTRWGHPMIITRPGQLADGTMAKAARPQAGLHFAHTDVQGQPSFEAAIASARQAVDALEAYLRQA